jgi:hypothetical protein
LFESTIDTLSAQKNSVSLDLALNNPVFKLLTAPPIAYRAVWITGNPLENLGGFILSAWAPDPPSGYYLGDILR